MSLSRSGTVRANGQELYFEVHGEGPPLVLVMGIGYDATLWTLAQVPALSQMFQVVIFDNRDVGRSSTAAAPYTIADMADDVAGLMDALDITRAHMLGLSMGGMIAQEFALRHADRLHRLVLSGCGAAPARVAFDPIRTWNWVKENDKSGEVFACQQFTWLFSTAFLRNKEAVQQTIAMLTSNPNPVGPEAYNRQAQAYLRYDALDRLGDIESRTLVIVGEQDLLTPPWVCREVADRIPDSTFEIIRGDGAAHVVPIERPDEFNHLVTRFLAASEPARDQADIAAFTLRRPRRTIASVITAAAILLGAGSSVTAQTSAHVIQAAQEVQWGPAPPLVPPGAQIAVLAGDPGKPAPYTVRLKFPANYSIPAHSHPTDEHVVVVRGALTLGMGDKLMKTASANKTLGVGGFAMLPAKMNHFAFTTAAETEIVLYGPGPIDFTYVNPADDPRSVKTSAR